MAPHLEAIRVNSDEADELAKTRVGLSGTKQIKTDAFTVVLAWVIERSVVAMSIHAEGRRIEITILIIYAGIPLEPFAACAVYARQLVFAVVVSVLNVAGGLWATFLAPPSGAVQKVEAVRLVVVTVVLDIAGRAKSVGANQPILAVIVALVSITRFVFRAVVAAPIAAMEAIRTG